MQKLIKFTKKHFFVILLVLLSIPTFFRMLRVGIYSMQDFHYFRLVEYGKCIKDLQLPCRWSADSGLGYGEPLFLFYGQISYFLGQMFRLFGLSNIFTLKLLFILSIVGSGLSMFYLSKKIWKSNFAGLISSIVYMYAPYRAVDVWVRGALPEALSFAIFPLVIYELELWFENKKEEYIIFFSLLIAILICTHNLSFIMFLVFLVPYLINKLSKEKNFKELAIKVLLYLGLSFFLSAFYIFPVIFESKFINLDLATTTGYFDFKGHFLTLKQILFSRNWGYGGSVFGEEDGLNLSVGIVQWIIPLLTIVLVGLAKNKKIKDILLFTIIGWFTLFLTHNKSTYIWKLLPFMKYIQFPWRFLSVSVFSFSLASGAISLKRKRFNLLVSALIITTSIGLTYNFFTEDIWNRVNDNELTSGEIWQEQTRASIKDYWPNFAKKVPESFAPDSFENQILLAKKSNYYKYSVYSENDTIHFFPITYFPGWNAYINEKKTEVEPFGDFGLVSLEVPSGKNIIEFKFSNVFVRKIGDLISLLSLVSVILLLIKNEKK
ncbi:6-pyruvoyl-tetrahydropterin synthase-related protein [Patescibacteria group bacterium]